MSKRSLCSVIAIVSCISCADAEASPSLLTLGDAGVAGSELVGTFNVGLIAPSQSDPAGHTSVLGKVYDGPAPSQLVWEQAASEGDCELLTPRAPFCEVSCGGRAVCVEDGVCQAYPTARSVGSVQLTGLKTGTGDESFTMEPIANAYQPKPSIKLPFPALAEGDLLQLSAAGAELQGFTLEARGIAPLALSTQEYQLAPDQALDLSWTKAKSLGSSRVRAKLDISHHGGSKGVIACDFDDDGEAQLPAALLTQLLELGVAGYPSLILSRESTASTNIRPGKVELSIVSKVERSVTIDGLSSCTTDKDCKSGETCLADLTCG